MYLNSCLVQGSKKDFFFNPTRRVLGVLGFIGFFAFFKISMFSARRNSHQMNV